MGKTTFLTKLALDWCDAVSVHNPDYKATFSDVDTLKEFRFLFQISLRDATDQREVTEMIKTQIIDMIYTGDKREETAKLLPQILERESCVITMDGLNEWVDRLNKCISPLMAQCLNKCVSVITTRPWKMMDERIKDSDIKTLIEIEGIIDEGELAKKILRSLQTGNVETHTDFMMYVNKRRLKHFITSPWRLSLLVNLWMNYEVTGSLCEINCILIDILFKNANARKGYFQKGTSFRCLTSTHFIKEQIDIFDSLANAAFSLTFVSNKSLVFNERELLNYMSEIQLEFCLRAGVLTKRYSSTVADQDAQFSFVHETMQDFLAAYHIANSNQDLIERFQTDTKYNVLEMSETIIYLCGLECKKANALINRLADVKFLNDINHGLSMYVKGFLGQKEILAFQTDNNTERHFLKTENNSIDYDKRCLALSVLFQRMIIAGYIEAKASGEKKIYLDCRDFTFNTYLNESDSNALKMLLLSNKSHVRSLILESNVLQTSEILTVVQQSKLCLKRVTMTVNSEIDKALYHTSLQEVRYIGNIDVSFSCVFPPMSQLTFLRINDSTLSEDIVLPDTIQHIVLFNCACTAVFLRRLLVRLSALKKDVRFDLNTLSVSECNTHIFHQELLSCDMQRIYLVVRDGNNDLYHLLRWSSIGKLDLRTADCASLALDIIHTLNKLTTLFLWGIYTGRCDLKLPASLHFISLQKGAISSEWLCSLLIELSSFDHPVMCELYDCVLQPNSKTRRDEPHTHVSDFRSKILSHDMSNIEIIVTRGAKELFEVLRDTSIGFLGLKSAECASLASEILFTLNGLTKLYLWGTYTGVCDFRLPASLQYINLQKVECSSGWLCSLLVKLSFLDHPATCDLYDVVLQSGEETLGYESHTLESDTQSKIRSHDLSNIEILVKSGNLELFELLRDTSIGSLRVIATDTSSLETVTRTQLNMVKQINIEGAYLTRFDHDFPQSIELLYLKKGTFSCEWLYSVLIRLSKVKHHVRLDVKALLVSSNETCSSSSEANVIQCEYSNNVRAHLNVCSYLNVSDLQSEMLLCDMSNIELRILNFHTERFEMLRDMSIRSVQLTAFDDASLTFVTQNTLPAFKEIRLQGTYLSGFNHKLPPTLQLLILEEGSCSSDWLYSLLIQLSTLRHSVRVYLAQYGVLRRRESSEKHSEPPMRGADLFNVKLEVRKDCPGLYETLTNTHITNLNMTQIEHADMLSQTLPLTYLQQLRICLKKYDMDMKLPKCIKYVFIIYKTFFPSSLIHFVQNLSTTEHIVQCKLVFRVEECEDEYTRIKQEYCESKSLNCQQFEVINKQGEVRGAAALTLSATADDNDDDADKHLLRREGEYVDSKPWIHYCKIRLNILCPDNSEGDS
ncbi:hypothetical protein DPMN_182137 [Dreissena polymorpha]|uniref:NACHT domain-containing protein n=1 Tax=Dreissena polymorpha TaxID=45954 RepID=A0A9D4DEV9_DREPO|nr:hypothetical protein DPMN_182137 [Dreissena polymorpha]